MNAKLLTLVIIFGAFLSVSLTYADNVPTHGEWDNERYRTITPAPPSLSIDGNVLCVHFIDALADLSIRIISEQGVVLLEESISGNRSECVPIILDQAGAGHYSIILEHKLGWLMGEFVIQGK